MSLVLTIVSLGTRVVLSYALAHTLGTLIIWWSIPIGWFLADLVGILYGVICEKDNFKISCLPIFLFFITGFSKKYKTKTALRTGGPFIFSEKGAGDVRFYVDRIPIP